MTAGAAALTAATLATTTGMAGAPSATEQPAVRATTTPGARAVTVPMSAATGAEIAGVRVDPQVATAVTQASGALAEAEHLTTEGNDVPAEHAAQIAQTTSVVRELVRRVETVDDPTATASDGETDRSATTGDPENGTADATTDSTTADSPAVDPAIGAAADAAVTAAAGPGTPATAADAQAVAAALTQQTAALAELIEAAPAPAVAVVPAPSPEEIAAQKAAEEAAAAAAEAARVAALAEEAKQYGNGEIPDHLLAPIPWSTTGSKLRADAAAALIRLNEDFKAAFGTDISITDSYRSYADQVAVKQLRGRWAAVPGYSNHGFGVAVDLGGGIADFGSPQHAWMKANAPAHGWIHPDWARQGGSKPEAWHWEFVG
jgi:LAS superfamily LD-carboxypeptidase LdcB